MSDLILCTTEDGSSITGGRGLPADLFYVIGSVSERASHKSDIPFLGLKRLAVMKRLQKSLYTHEWETLCAIFNRVRKEKSLTQERLGEFSAGVKTSSQRLRQESESWMSANWYSQISACFTGGFGSGRFCNADGNPRRGKTRLRRRFR